MGTRIVDFSSGAFSFGFIRGSATAGAIGERVVPWNPPKHEGALSLIDTKEAALRYADRGWKVVPMHSINEDGRCSCGAISNYMGATPHAKGKHPYTQHGHKDASKEHPQIHLWWAMWPDANVAIATGARSNIVVLDIDAKNGGYHSLSQWISKYGEIPKTPTVKSGGGGKHFYFRYPGRELHGRRGMLAGIDFFADGGRVVAPPSRHASGNRYEWEEGKSPDEVLLAPMPQWLIREVQTKRKPVPRRLRPPKPWFVMP